MKLKVTESFRFAHFGVRVVQYEKGMEIDTEEPGFDPELPKVAMREGWAKGPRAQRETAAATAAPENADAAGLAERPD